jgi:hypothetical protein
MAGGDGDGFDAGAFASKMSSIGHAGNMGGGGGGSDGDDSAAFHMGMGSNQIQQLIDTAMAGFVGSFLLIKGLIEAGIVPFFSILDQANVFRVLPPTSLPLLPKPGASLVSPPKGG